MCSHGTVPPRSVAYAGDFCRISSGEVRHTTQLIFLSDDIGEEFLNGFISSGHTVQEKMAIQVPG